MLLNIFDQKKGNKVSDMVDSLPSQNLYVIDALATLYDHFGEEKQIEFLKIEKEVTNYCKRYSISKIEQQQLMNCLEELEHYNFIEVPRKTVRIGIQKDCKKQVYSLKVDLDELINCLERHPLLATNRA